MDEEEQYKRQMQKRVAEAVRRAQIEERKKDLAKQLMDNKAYERLMNIKASNPELYSQLIEMLVSFAQSNRLQGKLTEEQLMALLQKITFKRDTTIEFKHK